MQKLSLAVIALLLSACGTHSKVIELDPETKLFPSNKQAIVVTSRPFDIDNRRSLVLVPDSIFDFEMTKNIGYFDEIIQTDDLEVLIVQNGLTDRVSSVNDAIGISKAAKHYKPFLWLRYKKKRDYSTDFWELILTDPLTLEDYFVAKTRLDYGIGVSDQNNWYPLYNALISYIRKNSKNSAYQ